MTTETEKLRDALSDLLKYVDLNTCTHDKTYRGGAIWTVCQGCGMQWADDEGGMPIHVDPPEVSAARQALTAEQPAAQEAVGEVGAMPGTSGFTMACFEAAKVPAGTKLYTRPAEPAAVPDVRWYFVSLDDVGTPHVAPCANPADVERLVREWMTGEPDGECEDDEGEDMAPGLSAELIKVGRFDAEDGRVHLLAAKVEG